MWTGLQQLIYTILNDSRVFMIAIIVAALVIAGVVLAVSGESGREKAKTTIIWIFAGVLVVIVGKQFIEYFVSKITF